MVYYRKYRPQRISELDSETVRERLKKVLSSGSLPQAFLFCGPKGTGKTSTARIVAKVVNCEKNSFASSKTTTSHVSPPGNFEPCNNCDNCKSITNGSHLDVLEIDAASNRGIDEIRDLREKIRLAPSNARFKVYIIDEVHMLTNEAFNALLKTLEEPPPHAIFILATTEADKLPETILSRCNRFDFRRATVAELLNSLGRIVNGEKLSLSDDILRAIAGASDGSFRDGAKILEQAVMEQATTLELVEKLLGQANTTYQKLLEQVFKRDTRMALRILTDLVDNGADLKYVISAMLESLHQQLLRKTGVIVSEGSKEVENQLSIEDISLMVRMLEKTYQETKFALLPQIPLELFIIEWGERKKI